MAAQRAQAKLAALMRDLEVRLPASGAVKMTPVYV